MTIIYAAILFIILIFPHELGHFLVAKSVGVKVNEFAFGMGPALYKKQKGETLYSIRMVPIGGYCAMEGENEESDNDRAFNNKPGWAKIAVLIAGSAMNVAIAIIVMSIISGVNGTPTTTIDKVTENSPAYTAGVQEGDTILSIDGEDVESWGDLSYMINKSKEEISLTVNRSDDEITLSVFPEKEDDGRYVIGVTPELNHGVFTAIKQGGSATWNIAMSMYDSLKMMITGEVSTDQIAGPVGIVSMVSDTAQYGLIYFAYLLALMSLNLAIINMLPFPALDGGRVIFVIIRKVTGKMITDELEGRIHMIGMALLLGLLVFVTWNDIMRLIG